MHFHSLAVIFALLRACLVPLFGCTQSTCRADLRPHATSYVLVALDAVACPPCGAVASLGRRQQGMAAPPPHQGTSKAEQTEGDSDPAAALAASRAITLHLT